MFTCSLHTVHKEELERKVWASQSVGSRMAENGWTDECMDILNHDK